MADDYDATTASLGGGWRSGGEVDSGLGKRLNSYDERLQDMRKHLRSQQDKQDRSDIRRKNRDKEMAQQWVEHQDKLRKEQKQEVECRLAKMKQKTAKPRLGRKVVETHGSIRQGSREKAANGSKSSNPSVRQVSGEQVANAVGILAEGEELPAISQHAPLPALPQQLSSESASGTAAKKVRTGGLPQREKSIMQQAQEQFQGLCRSADGRAILELGKQHQKLHRAALVKGDPVAVEKFQAEQAGHHESGEEEKEVEDQEHPNEFQNKNMARRYRLRMMHQITSQVLQCRKKMTSNMQNSFLSPSGLGCTTQVENVFASAVPALPVMSGASSMCGSAHPQLRTGSA